MSAPTAAVGGHPMTIDELLAQRAVLGERVALADEHRQLSYDDLDRRTARLAASLQARFAAGERIACRYTTGVDAAVAFLAVVRAGLVWVGVSPGATDVEVAAVCAEVGAVAQFGDADPLPDDGAAAAFDRSWSVDGRRPAVISSTSGSSGTPKRVVHSQGNVLLPAWSAVARGEASGVTGLYLPLSSVNMHVLGPLSALAGGGRCQMISNTVPAAVADSVRRYRIDTLPLAAPTVIDWLHDGVDGAALASLVRPVIGGSSAPGWVFEAYADRTGNTLTLGYGLTEAPSSVTRHQRGRFRPGSSGQPLDHLEVRIVDESAQPVADGEAGQITVTARRDGPWAGAWRPMLGYWGDAERTEQVCRHGVLYTGDVGRFEDGSLYVEGRADDVIIRGGSNISPAEVEAVIAQVDGVTDVVVVGRHDRRLGQVPVAVVAGRFTVDDVISACAKHLAAYKRPVAIVGVGRLPRTAAGKPVRSAIEALAAEGGDGFRPETTSS